MLFHQCSAAGTGVQWGIPAPGGRVPFDSRFIHGVLGEMTQIGSTGKLVRTPRYEYDTVSYLHSYVRTMA